MEYLTREHISSALGVASIVAWLGAQAPQLYKNWCNSSVNGLALPFLVSWLFGDLTNLIGCLLTHQLPFQSWLATYFVIIDVGLMSQYIYYTSRNPLPSLPPLSASYPHLHPHQHSHSHTRASTYHHQTWESARKVSRKRKAKGGEQQGRGRRVTDGTGTGTEEDPMMQSWTSSNPPTPTSSRPQTIRAPLGFSSLPSTPLMGSSSSPTERGRTLTRPHPRPTTFFGHGLETISGSPASGSLGPLQQQMLNEGEGPPPEWSMRHTSSNSRSRPPPPARRSSSMVFLSVGLLVGFGRWSGGRTSEVGGKAWGSRVESGTVSGLRTTWTALQHPYLFAAPVQASVSALRRRQVFPLEVSVVDSSPAGQHTPPPGDESPPQHDPDDSDPYPERNLERFFGRASAWVCTTLYLTSRLPQIWQNFRRRSVEGLSMLLFIMAFVGNSLYVLSILTNPLASYPGYLLEATPYLMGSGGTLFFDITIVLQGYFYSEPRSSRRRKTGKYAINTEESAAFLTADTEGSIDDADGYTAGRRSRSASRTRERSQSSRRPLSLSRSDSTELAKSKQRWSGDPRHGLEDDRDFDFTRPAGGGEGTQRVRGTQSAGGSRSRTRPTSIIEAIPEETESGVTIRMG